MVKLEQNYRSHGHILDSANHLIANNTGRLGKNLRTELLTGFLTLRHRQRLPQLQEMCRL
jgi:superfamily I DNA/RNA helicase